MNAYRVTYNLHRYSDCSDPARQGRRTFKAENRDALDGVLFRWRENHNDVAPTARPRRSFIGLIHFAAIESKGGDT